MLQSPTGCSCLGFARAHAGDLTGQRTLEIQCDFSLSPAGSNARRPVGAAVAGRTTGGRGPGSGQSVEAADDCTVRYRGCGFIGREPLLAAPTYRPSRVKRCRRELSIVAPLRPGNGTGDSPRSPRLLVGHDHGNARDAAAYRREAGPCRFWVDASYGRLSTRLAHDLKYCIVYRYIKVGR